MKNDVIHTPIYSNSHDYSRYKANCETGQIFDTQRSTYLDLNPNANNYTYAGLRDGNTGKYHYYGVHRLIACSSSGIPLELFKRGGIEVDHITPVNLGGGNEISNLNLTDRKGQYREDTRERMRKPKRRLKESEVCEILEQLYKLKETEDFDIGSFIKDMCEAYSMQYRTMYNIVKGYSYKDLHSKAQ